MIELCFGQSTQGALRCAQHCGGGGRKAFGVIFGRAEADGSGEDVESTTVIGYDDGKKPTKREIRQIQRDFQRKQEELAREAIPLGGNPGDVLALSLGLDMGDIGSPWERAVGRCSGSGTARTAQAIRSKPFVPRNTRSSVRRQRRSGCGPSAPATPSASGRTRRPTAPAGCSTRPAC